MITKVLAAALAACALTAPTAHADPPVYNCEFVVVADPTREAGWHTGVLVGYVVHGGGGEVTIECEVVVNGTTAFRASGTGAGAAWIGPRVFNFPMSATDDIGICATATTVHGSQTTCYEPTQTQIPPQEVFDVVCPVVTAVNDRLGTQVGCPPFEV